MGIMSDKGEGEIKCDVRGRLRNKRTDKSREEERKEEEGRREERRGEERRRKR